MNIKATKFAKLTLLYFLCPFKSILVSDLVTYSSK